MTYSFCFSFKLVSVEMVTIKCFRSTDPPRRGLHCVPHQPNAVQLMQTSGALDPAGRVQVAEETLSTQLPDLCGGFLSPRHHRYSTALSITRHTGHTEPGTFTIVFSSIQTGLLFMWWVKLSQSHAYFVKESFFWVFFHSNGRARS